MPKNDGKKRGGFLSVKSTQIERVKKGMGKNLKVLILQQGCIYAGQELRC